MKTCHTLPCAALMAGIALGMSACVSQPAIDPQQARLQPDHMPESRPGPELVHKITIAPEPISEERIVCRREVRLGSHVPRRYCESQRYIDRRMEEAQAFIRSKGAEGSVTTVRFP